MEKSIDSPTRWINVVSFIIMVIVNGLAGSTTLIGGKNTAEVSDAYPTLVTPAGYVFAIWGIIYILLGIFAYYQTTSGQKVKEYRNRIGWLFALSCAANVTWLFLWQFEYLTVSVAVMFVLLASLILIYLRLDIGKSAATIREKIAFHLPFSVYLGWITIATIANISVALVSARWDGFGVNPQTWASVVVIVALIITLLVLASRRDVAYSLVIIWALIGISVNQSANQLIVLLTQVSAAIVAIAIVVVTLIPRLRKR